MKAQNTLLERKPKVTFSAAITSNSMQNMIKSALGDPKVAARFTSTLISAVTQSEALKECEPSTIVATALRGEGMGLIYGQGYYVVPYKQTATFILAYKGYIQLALATGQYADINALEIRKGELAGRDPRTGRWRVNLAAYSTDEEREAQPIIGYYAYFELKDGTFRSEYWSLDKLLQHADRYSPAFSLEKFRDLQEGKLKPEDAKKLLNGTPWYDEGEGQAKMCKKTVLRQLLNSGYAPLNNEVRAIFREDEAVEDTVPFISSEVVFQQEENPSLNAQEPAEDSIEDARGEDKPTSKNAPQAQEKAGDPDPVSSFFDQNGQGG